MSWYTSAKDIERETAKETLGALQVQLGTANHAPEESLAQFAQAVEAAVRLIQSGAVGAGPFHVSLGGHANPSHGDVPGYAQDCINVSVTRQAKP